MLGGGGNQTKTLPKKSRYKTPPAPKPFGGKRPKAVRTVSAQFPAPGPSPAPLRLHPSPLLWHRTGRPVSGDAAGGMGTSLPPPPAPSQPEGQTVRPAFDTQFPGYLSDLGAVPVWLLELASLPSILPHIPPWCLHLALLDATLRPAVCTAAREVSASLAHTLPAQPWQSRGIQAASWR